MMDDFGGGSRQRPLSVTMVRGEAYQVAGRTLVPLARRTCFAKASATIGSQQLGGWGTAYVRMTPVAFLEQTGEGERVIPISDGGAVLRRNLLLLLTVLTLALALVRAWARR